MLYCNKLSTGDNVEYLRDEHRVHFIVYHLVWTPRRRKPVLTGKVASRCKETIESKCEEKGWEIVELAITRRDQATCAKSSRTFSNCPQCGRGAISAPRQGIL